METTLYCTKCKQEDLREDDLFLETDEYHYRRHIKCQGGKVIEVCRHCLGTGEVTTMEEAELGNPGTLAPIGTRPCICQVDKSDPDEAWDSRD